MEGSVYLCTQCKKIFKVQGNDKKIKCKQCSVELIDVHISMEEWAGYDAQKKEEIKQRICGREEIYEINESDSEPANPGVGSFFEHLGAETMFCPYCGAENEADSQFCFACGKNIGEQIYSDAETENPLKTEDDKKADSIQIVSCVKKGKDILKNCRISKITMVAVIVLAAVAAVLILGSSVKNGISKISGSGDNVTLKKDGDSDDIVILPLMNGKYVEIKNVEYAYITPDRKKIVAKDISDKLYITDTDQKSKNVIENDLGEGYVRTVEDDFVIYIKDDNTYMYRFEGGEPFRLTGGQIGECLVRSGNLIFWQNEGLYLLKKSASEKEKVTTFDSNCSFLHFTKDGKRIYWCEKDSSDEKYDVFCYTNGEKTKICSYSSSTAPDMNFNENESYGILVKANAESFYIIDNKGNTTKVGMGNPIIYDIDTFFTAEGPLRFDKSSSFKGLYTIADTTNAGGEEMFYHEKATLYYIDSNGEREKMLSDISGLQIRNGSIYYLKDDELKYAKLDGPEIKKEKKIADDVNRLDGSKGDYIYFLKDKYKSNNGKYFATLYMCKDGNEPEKVCDEAYLSTCYPSEEGKTLYFFKDPDSDKNSYYDCASLYKYTYGQQKAEKIADSVCCDMLYDGTNNDTNKSYNFFEINDSFVYYKKIESNDFQWMYYDGKKSISMISQIEPDRID